MPTAAHLPIGWTMGYDLEPLRTMESKKSILARAMAEDWLLALVHDHRHPLGKLSESDRGYRFEPIDFGGSQA
jgi:hypothetical protein